MRFIKKFFALIICLIALSDCFCFAYVNSPHYRSDTGFHPLRAGRSYNSATINNRLYSPSNTYNKQILRIQAGIRTAPSNNFATPALPRPAGVHIYYPADKSDRYRNFPPRYNPYSSVYCHPQGGYYNTFAAPYCRPYSPGYGYINPFY